MEEISLNILDIVQNSIKAKSSYIQIKIEIIKKEDLLRIKIKDDGMGMSKDSLEKVVDPFFSTRKTRTIGLGIPFFKHAAEITGGNFTINSKLGQGTTVVANFVLSHIDRMPLGNMVDTIHLLITMNPDIRFLYTYVLDDKVFSLDTNQLKEVLGDLPFNIPEVSNFIKEYLIEHHNEINGTEYI